MSLGPELATVVRGAPVLPDDGIVNRLPVSRFHTIAVSRWLVIPIAATSRGRAWARLRASTATLICELQISSGLCSTQPGLRKYLLKFALCYRHDRALRSKTIARELVVP